jgi:predicted transcriptional regulator
MASEGDYRPAPAAPEAAGQAEKLEDPSSVPESPGSRGDSRDERGRLNLTDPKAIRALAHPVRWALLEALGQAGTLTATQASEMLGESPANCAFHLRTLAKYGFVEEAGGGRGRERPWRQSYNGMSWGTRHDDPQASQAATQALDQVWMDRMMSRARRSLTSPAAWPEDLDDSLGASATRLYVTPEEASQLYAEIQRAWNDLFGTNHRFAERRDPKLRPADAIPVEFVLFAYPLLDLPPLPDAGEAHDGVPDRDGSASPG